MQPSTHVPISGVCGLVPLLCSCYPAGPLTNMAIHPPFLFYTYIYKW